jgi:hypothetical protein
MPTRADKSRANRRRYLQQRLAAAETPIQELHVACDGLKAAARRAGRVPETTRAVLALIEDLTRQEVA